jgi:hypothetical protein
MAPSSDSTEHKSLYLEFRLEFLIDLETIKTWRFWLHASVVLHID